MLAQLISQGVYNSIIGADVAVNVTFWWMAANKFSRDSVSAACAAGTVRVKDRNKKKT